MQKRWKRCKARAAEGRVNNALKIATSKKKKNKAREGGGGGGADKQNVLQNSIKESFRGKTENRGKM